MPNNNWVALSGDLFSHAWNWSTSVVPSGDTDVIFSSGFSNYNCTIDTSPTVLSLVTSGSYGGALSWAGQVLTVSGNLTLDGSGTVNLGNGVTCNGASSNFYIGSTVGTVTSSNAVLTYNTTTSGTFNTNKALTISQIVLNSGAIATFYGSSITVVCYVPPSINLGNNTSFTQNNNILLALGANGNFVTVGTNYIYNGVGTLEWRAGAGGIIMNIPNFTYTGTGNFTLSVHAYAGCTYNIATLSAINSNIIIPITYNVSPTFNITSITCKSLAAGNENALGTTTINWGTGPYNLNSYSGNVYNNSTTIDNLQSSIWNVSGNFNFGSNHTVNAGTSIVNITNTSTVTSANKAFYDFNVNTAASGTVVTFADSPRISGDFTVTQGSTNLSNLNWSGYGDVLFDGTGNHTIGSGITLVNPGTFRLNSTLLSCVSAGCYVKCNNTATLTLDGRTLNRLGLTTGKTYTWTTGTSVPTINTYTTGDWDGTTLVSSTPTTRYKLKAPASVTLSNCNIRDCDNSTGTLITANNGTNTTGGNNLNIKFMNVISILPITGDIAGGTTLTVSDTGNSFGGSFTSTLDGAACTSPTILTTQTGSCVSASHVAGAVDFVILTSDGETQTLTGGYTYTGAPFSPPTISGQLIEMRFYNPFLHTQYIAKGRRVLRAVQRYIGS